MTISSITIDDLKQQWEECERKAELVENELNALRAKIAAYQLIIADLNTKTASTTGGSGLHSTIRPSQLTNCKTQRDAWVQIANLSGGFVKPSEGAQLIIDLGLTKKSRRDVASNGASWMANSDKWQWTDKGLYRLLDPTAADAYTQKDEDAWHGKPSQIDNGDASLHTSPANEDTVADQPRIIA